MLLQVCPTCGNMLRVSKVPVGDPSTELSVGLNRFECLTCPYQYVLNKQYYERQPMPKKQVEDILGGKGAWDKVDKTKGSIQKRRRACPGCRCVMLTCAQRNVR